jgi:hypothetical protein
MGGFANAVLLFDAVVAGGRRGAQSVGKSVSRGKSKLGPLAGWHRIHAVAE